MSPCRRHETMIGSRDILMQLIARVSTEVKVYPIVYLITLSGLSLYALIGLSRTTPWLAGLGLLLACLAPLGFIVQDLYRRTFGRHSRGQGHPVVISILCGFGAVMAMVAVERFGAQHQTFVVGSAIALAGWLVYVRWYGRFTNSRAR